MTMLEMALSVSSSRAWHCSLPAHLVASPLTVASTYCTQRRYSTRTNSSTSTACEDIAGRYLTLVSSAVSSAHEHWILSRFPCQPSRSSVEWPRFASEAVRSQILDGARCLGNIKVADNIRTATIALVTNRRLTGPVAPSIGPRCFRDL